MNKETVGAYIGYAVTEKEVIEDIAHAICGESFPCERCPRLRECTARYQAKKVIEKGYHKDPMELYLCQQELVEAVWGKVKAIVRNRLMAEAKATENKETKYRIESVFRWFDRIEIQGIREVNNND